MRYFLVVWIWANKKMFGPKEKLINHDATMQI
jgi:hypothetical protein